jgi:competence protein ComGC
MNKRVGKNQDGFGLLAMVFLILTISISVITFMTVINPSTLTRKNVDTTNKAAILRSAVQSYRFSHGGASGTIPPTLDSLVTTDAVPCVMDNTPASSTYLYLQGWCGPYVDRVFVENSADFKKDGWGTLFSFNAGTSVITSCGPNLSCGDGDDLVYSP